MKSIEGNPVNATDPTGLDDVPKYTDPDVQFGYFKEAVAEQVLANYLKYLGQPPLPGENKTPDLPKADPVMDWAKKTSGDLKKLNSDLERVAKSLSNGSDSAKNANKFLDSLGKFVDDMKRSKDGYDAWKAAQVPQAQTSQVPQAPQAQTSQVPQAVQTEPKN